MAICPNCESRSDNVLDPCPTGDGYFCVEEAHYAAIRDDDLLGVAVDDRFVVVALLGVGSMAQVYRAHQLEVDRTVALKVFRADELFDDSMTGGSREQALKSSRRRFVQEAKVLGKLAHPNCVMLFDFGTSDEGRYLYIAMEHVGGISLRRAMNRGLKLQAILEITEQVLMALREAHSIGIVHRDLKPENIILSFKYSTEEAVVKVVDFGIAKLLGKHEVDTTNVGALFGTPAYMSPEQCRGEADEVGPHSDIYSLGCILYEIVTGHLPFESSVPMQMIRMHIEREPPAIEPRAGLEVPDELAEFITTCMQKNPADRYPDAHTALLAFADTVGSESGGGFLADRMRRRSGSARRGYGKAVVVPTNQIAGIEMEPPRMEPKSTEQADDVPVEVQWDAEASEDSSVFETRNDENGRRRHPPRNSATAIGPLLVVIAFVFALTACVLLFYFMWQSVG
jgi:serine/threonine-protein kinase